MKEKTRRIGDLETKLAEATGQLMGFRDENKKLSEFFNQLACDRAVDLENASLKEKEYLSEISKLKLDREKFLNENCQVNSQLFESLACIQALRSCLADAECGSKDASLKSEESHSQLLEGSPILIDSPVTLSPIIDML